MAGAAMVLGRDAGVDPSWPPVLVVLVAGAVIAAVVSIVVVFRRLRAAGRSPDRSRGASGR